MMRLVVLHVADGQWRSARRSRAATPSQDEGRVRPRGTHRKPAKAPHGLALGLTAALWDGG